MPELYSAQMAALLGGAGAFGAAFLALIGVLVANSVAKRLKQRELFQNALEFLTGGTQKRSVGIAILTDYADTLGVRAIVAPIFTAQMLHLKAEGHHRQDTARPIEYFNYRLMEEAVAKWGLDFSCLLPSNVAVSETEGG